MTRKGVWLGFPYLFGLIAAGLLHGENGYILLLAALGFGIIGTSALKDKRKYVIICTLSFMLGVAANMLYTRFVYDKLVKYDGEEVTINGYVKEVDYIGADTVLLNVKGEIDGIGTEISCFTDNDDFRYYDKVSLKAEVSRITDSINFLSEDYNYSKNVFLKSDKVFEISHSSVCENYIFRAVKEYRDKLKTTLCSAVGDEEAAFLSAVLCGDKSDMPQSMKTQMYRSGLGHIFAVSGAHLVIVTAMFTALVSVIVKNKRLRIILVLTQVWGFALFAGLSVTVVRAAVMLTVSELGFFFGRESDCANSLGICAVLLTVGKPYSALSPSFLMSFSAVFALGVIAPKITELIPKEFRFKKTVEYAVSSICVLFFTAPLCIAFFGSISIISVATNILLVPLCALALQMSFICIFTGGAELLAIPLFKLSALIIKPVLVSTEYLSEIPYAYITLAHKGIAVTAALSAMLPFLVIYKGTAKRFTAGCVSVVCLWITLSNSVRIADNSVKITVFPDRKDTCYTMCCDGKAIIFDVGSKGSMNGALERFLCAEGIDSTEMMFISEESIYTVGKSEESFSNPPKLYFGSAEANEIYDNAERFEKGSMLTRNGCEILASEDGFTLKFDDLTVALMSGKFSINDDIYDVTDEDYPLNFTLTDPQVRRLDYEFN